MWNKIKPFLVKKNINLNDLTNSQLVNNQTLIPHLLDHLKLDVVFGVLKDVLNIAIFDHKKYQQKDIKYLDDSYVILTRDGKYIAYAINPFSDTINYQIKSKAIKLGIKNNMSIGIIASNNSLFLKNSKKSINKIDEDKLLDDILLEAINIDASDIHIQPRNQDFISIFFRVMGQIQDSKIPDIPMNNYPKFINSLQNKAGINAGEYVGLKEQKFSYTINDSSCNIRLQQNTTIYTFLNDKKVPSFILRIHKSQKTEFKSLKNIGLLTSHSKALKSISQHRTGLIIAAGPTGSGKTTTLYATLAEATKTKNVIVQTIEDPVEISIPGINQMNIAKKVGISYESSLKAILRSDIDIALIGEIRSEETARGVINLDQTGHLVFSTIHAKNSLAVIDRLRQFNISNNDIADSISAIISSRLVRKVCHNCAIDSEEIGQMKSLEKYQINFGLQAKIKIANSAGCLECNHGYMGRLLVAEVIVMDDSIKNKIINNASNADIETHIYKHGNKSIWNHGIELVLSHQTTLDALEESLPVFTNFGRNYSPEESVRL